jgi:streptogramin lyase
MKVHNVSRMTALFVVLVLLVGLWGLFGVKGHPAHAWPEGEFPHATVKVWDTLVPLGATPSESVEDPAGVTGHGTGTPTIATLYARSTRVVDGPTGISYWNPDENVFVWYGKTMGYPSTVDINRGGPVQEGGPFGTSFGPGDIWIGAHALEPLIVHIAGTDMFRSYGTSNPVGPPSGQVWGLDVDEATGMVWLGQPDQGRISRVHPPTGQVFVWSVGCQPAYVTLDQEGRPYATLTGLTGCAENAQFIVRVDHPDLAFVSGAGADTVTAWPVPSLDGTPSFRQVPPPPVLGEENPNGLITADADGNIWFAESNSNEIGRLSGGPDGIIGTDDDLICEFTKPGLLNPQQITTTGFGELLQVYFTEGDGNSVSVLTQVEADRAEPPTRVCTTVSARTFTVETLGVFTATFDEAVAPERTVITPTVHDVPGLDGFASGTTTTADGQPIPPILRFSPMPNPLLSVYGTPIGDAPLNGFPSGLTGVYGHAKNRVAGAYLRGNKHFELTSGAIIAPPPDDAPPPHHSDDAEDTEAPSPTSGLLGLF